jgi:hypothetical protein
MQGAVIPYFASFWIAGSRAGGFKNGSLLFVPYKQHQEFRDIEIDKRRCVSVTYLWKLHQHLKHQRR